MNSPNLNLAPFRFPPQLQFPVSDEVSNEKDKYIISTQEWEVAPKY